MSPAGMSLFNQKQGSLPSLADAGSTIDPSLAELSKFINEGKTVPFMDQLWPNAKVQQTMLSGLQEIFSGQTTADKVLAGDGRRLQGRHVTRKAPAGLGRRGRSGHPSGVADRHAVSLLLGRLAISARHRRRAPRRRGACDSTPGFAHLRAPRRTDLTPAEDSLWTNSEPSSDLLDDAYPFE